MSNSARLQLGFSPLSKTIMLAKMRDVEGGRMRVGNDPGRDVTNEAAQLVWQLVMAEGGEIVWELDDGSRRVLDSLRQAVHRRRQKSRRQPVSEINYQALREVAERATPAMERLLMLPADDDLLSEQELKDYGVDIDALNAFKFLAGPETVLALLDER